jgi:hypothetical protein
MFSNNNDARVDGAIFSDNYAAQGEHAPSLPIHAIIQVLYLFCIHLTHSSIDSFFLFNTTVYCLNLFVPQKGGALYLGERNNDLHIEDCYFGRNEANMGGAIYFYINNFDYKIEDSEFESNRADYHGGAMYLYSNNNFATFDNVNFTNNKADDDGTCLL